MGLQEIAARLADTNRIGLSPQLAEKLKLPPAETLRGQLMALCDDDRGPLSVSLLAVYVVDDTDLWGDGEILLVVDPGPGAEGRQGLVGAGVGASRRRGAAPGGDRSSG